MDNKSDIDPQQLEFKNCIIPLEYKKMADGSLKIKGWISRIEKDDGGDIVLPEAFAPVIARYMQKPIAAWNHNLDNIVGKTDRMEVRPNEGVWADQTILPTSGAGADVIMLIEAGVVNSFSFSFSMIGGISEYDDKTQTRTIKQIGRLFEVGPVAIGMNELAVMQKLQEIKSIKSNTGQPGVVSQPGRVSNMEDLDVVKRKMESVEVKLTEVQKESDRVAKLEAELKDFRERAQRTADENDAFLKKFVPEYTASMTALTEAISEIKSRGMVGAIPLAAGFEMKDLMFAPTMDIKASFGPDTAGRALYLRNLYDDLLLIDAFKGAGKNGDRWLRAPMDMRLKSTKTYRKFERLAKEFFGPNAVDASFKEFMDVQAKAAWDTAGSNEGAEYLWTAYSGNLIDLIRWDYDLMQLHERFFMAAASVYLPVEGADSLATRSTQTTSKATGPSSTTQTPGSDNCLFTAEKLRGNTQWSSEADEDLIIASAAYIRRKVAKSIERAINKAIVSGDDAAATSYDSGDAPGTTDCRYCWNGYRGISRHASYLNSGYLVDMGTFNETNLNKVLANLGKYYKDAVIIMSVKGYLMHMINPTEMPSLRTRDKYGDAATVVTGEAAQYQGKPVLQSEWVLDTFDSSGVYSAAGQTKTALIAASRSGFMLGDRRNVTMEVVRDASNDIYDIYSYWRGDFQNVFPATDVIVSEGKNISTT